MSVDDLLTLAHDATSSRVLDALMEAPTVPKMVKRKLILSFVGHFHLLVDDRIGSRVGDRLWAAADPYLKVRPIS
jgi:nucleolar protein 9